MTIERRNHGMTRVDAAISGQLVQVNECRTCRRLGFRIFEKYGDQSNHVAGANRFLPCRKAGHDGLVAVGELPFEAVPW